MIQQIEYVELPDFQAQKVDELTNKTLPQGQSFFIENGEVICVDNSVRELFEAQNRKGIEAGTIQEIV